MCSIDLEQSEVWDETERTARTPKACDCCHGPIVPGQRYVKHFSIYDGSVTSENLCKLCEKDRDEFAKAHDNMSPTPSGFTGMLSECVDDTEDDRWAEMLRAIEARKDATNVRA